MDWDNEEEPNYKIELGKFDSFGYEFDYFTIVLYILILLILWLIF